MDDKKLDRLMKGLKDEYDRLPEFSSEQKIVPLRDESPTKRKGKRFFSYVASVAGVFLFLVLALTTIDGYQESNVSKGYLVNYFEEKKDEFRKILNVESVDEFSQIKQLEIYIDSLPEELNSKDIELAKEQIDGSLTTPFTIIEEVNSGKKDLSKHTVIHLLRTTVNLGHSLDDHFSKLKVEYQLKSVDQEELLENQYEYKGHQEIVEFLDGVHREGYHVVDTGINYQRKYQVRPNFSLIASKIDNWEGYEGIQTYLIFLDERFDIYYPGADNIHGVPWEEFDDVLLELENIYHDYPEVRDIIFRDFYTSALFSADAYLTDYVSGHGNDEFWQYQGSELEEELKGFIEENPDSIYVPIISDAIEYHRKNDWQQAMYHGKMSIRTLFSLQEAGIDHEFILYLHHWPISEFTLTLYSHYEETGDLSYIINASPFETLSLYMYTSRVDEDLHEKLKMDEADLEETDWVKIYEQAEILKEEYVDEYTAEYTILDFTANPIAKITVIFDGTGWKVADQSILENY